MQTYSLVASRNLIRAEREMLKHAEPIKVLSNFGTQKQQPKNMTDTIVFRRVLPLDYSSTTYAPVVNATDYVLNEGSTPAPRTINYQDVSVTLQQYGILLQLSSKAELMYEDDIPGDMIKLAGEHMATIEEMINYGVVRAGTTVYFPGSITVRTDCNAAITLNVLRKTARALEARHAKHVNSRLASGPNFGNAAVHPGYLVFIHTDVESDARNLAGFTSVVDYGSFKPVHEREIGAVEQFRFITSPYFRPIANAATGVALNGMESTGGTYADVYQTLVVAQDAWGQVALKGMGAAKPRYLPASDINHANPMGQFGFVSASFWKAAVRLNESWMVRIEHAVTDL